MTAPRLIDAGPSEATVADRLVAELTAGRARTLGLLDPLREADLVHQHSALMSPLVWDLGHVANYEELWLLRAVTGEPPARPELDDVYDAFSHPRRDRPTLPMLGPTDAFAYAAGVRARVLDGLERLDFGAGSDPLVGSGFVHAMVLQHEHQHAETMLATLGLMAAPGYRPVTGRGAVSGDDAGGSDHARQDPAGPTPAAIDPRARRGTGPGHGAAPGIPAEVLLPGGSFTMGTSADRWALDNERPAHAVEVAPFWLGTTPVTNDAYVSFVGSGGYEDRRWWTPAGWAWCREAGLEHPQFWVRDGSGWGRNRFGWMEPLPGDEPVQHVCWYEADAFARWAGRRLPTEAEWEFAASVAPDGTKRRWPWGDADPSPERATLWWVGAPALGGSGPGGSAFGPAAVGGHPPGANPWGVAGLIGDVWEWTSSDFRGHPGFSAWPYREYSEVFFGPGYKVLRGGSWATHPCAIRATFRNWDYPIRRQIFAGFRCAGDA